VGFHVLGGRRTTPGHRKAKPKTKQECGDYNRRLTHDVHGEDEDWSGPYTDDSDSDDNESEYDEGGSENGDLYSGDDPRLRMTTEELEEMEPGFTTRFDGEWEQKIRNSDRKHWELMKKKKQYFRSETEQNKK
jgi:hypothetical protein